MHPNKRSRKRARQAEAAVEGQHRFRYGLMAVSTLKETSLESLGLAVADVEIKPQLSGEPDEMFGWLIFATEDEVKRARSVAPRIEARIKAALVASGFPPSAAASFEVGFTCFPEIEAGGGRFQFFRA
jgi:hypothetical protein